MTNVHAVSADTPAVPTKRPATDLERTISRRILYAAILLVMGYANAAAIEQFIWPVLSKTETVTDIRRYTSEGLPSVCFNLSGYKYRAAELDSVYALVYTDRSEPGVWRTVVKSDGTALGPADSKPPGPYNLDVCVTIPKLLSGSDTIKLALHREYEGFGSWTLPVDDVLITWNAQKTGFQTISPYIVSNPYTIAKRQLQIKAVSVSN